MFLKRGGRTLLFGTLLCIAGTCVKAAELCAHVADPSRLPLPSASVHATNLHTGKAYRASSNSNGAACLPHIPEGLYAVETSLAGFLNIRYYPVHVTYPSKTVLYFSLPIAEVNEGGVGQESTISGTLNQDSVPLADAKICILGDGDSQIACNTTNDLGEYALLVVPGVYGVEVCTRRGKQYKSTIDVSTPGIYRDKLEISKLIAPQAAE